MLRVGGGAHLCVSALHTSCVSSACTRVHTHCVHTHCIAPALTGLPSVAARGNAPHPSAQVHCRGLGATPALCSGPGQLYVLGAPDAVGEPRVPWSVCSEHWRLQLAPGSMVAGEALPGPEADGNLGQEAGQGTPPKTVVLGGGHMGMGAPWCLPRVSSKSKATRGISAAVERSPSGPAPPIGTFQGVLV